MNTGDKENLSHGTVIAMSLLWVWGSPEAWEGNLFKDGCPDGRAIAWS